jgi:cytochrome c oxidase assembly protein subunit 15
LTSRFWLQPAAQRSESSGKLQRLASITAALAYLQLIAGAWLRHRPAQASPDAFRIVVFFHLLLAAALLVHVALLMGRVWRGRHEHGGLGLPASLLCVLLLGQLALGGGTWVVKYGWPDWFSEFAFAQQYVVRQGSLSQTWITTSHVAVGSLIFGVSIMVMLRSWRPLGQSAPAGKAPVKSLAWEAAR